MFLVEDMIMLFLIALLFAIALLCSVAALWIQSLCDIDLDNLDLGILEKELCT